MVWTTWTNIQSWSLFTCSFPVILMFYINFAGGLKLCWPSCGVTQGVWMGLLWGSLEELAPGQACFPLLKTRRDLSSLDTRGTLWCCSPTWILDSMLSRDQLIVLRNKPNSLNISRSMRKTLLKFNLWNPSSKYTAKVKNHIKTFAHSKCGLLNARTPKCKSLLRFWCFTDYHCL